MSNSIYIGRLRSLVAKVVSLTGRFSLNLIFIIGVFGLFVSLYFSEVMDLPPCDLCWYQRIFFYPIPVIALIGLLRKDKTAISYIFVLALLGLPISIYHHLLKITELFPKETVFCGEAGACSELEWELWTGSGITIPLLATLGFLAVMIISLVVLRNRRS